MLLGGYYLEFSSFIPLFGLAARAASGAIVGSMKHIAIDDDFTKYIRSKVTEGTSALFLMTSDAVEQMKKKSPNLKSLLLTCQRKKKQTYVKHLLRNKVHQNQKS